MITNTFLFLLTLVGLMIYVLVPSPFWAAGLILIILGWLLYLVAVFPDKSADTRGWWVLAACLTVISAITISLLRLFYQRDPITIQGTPDGLTLPYIEVTDLPIEISPIVSSLFFGVPIAILLTVLLFIAIGYLSSVYAVALYDEQKDDDQVTFWDEFKSFFFLIFNKHLGWQIVENGKIRKLRSKGYVDKWLSRGKIIVKPGNAIVTERGGKIMGIHGPGTIITIKDQTIREVFDLRNQFKPITVKNVITADQIPLKVALGVGYRLKPLTEEDDIPANDENVIKEGSLGVFAIHKDTLVKAAFKNSAGGGWRGLAEGASVGQLRDQFMTYNVEQLFTMVDTPDGNNTDEPTPLVNQRQIKAIEDSIKDTVNSFAGDLGVEITTIDISEISLPRDMRQMLVKSRAEAEAIERIETNRNEARSNLVTRILQSISTGTGERIGATELQLATEFARISRRALADDVLGHQYIDMLKAISEGDATKIFNVTPAPSTIEPEHIPMIQSQNGNGHRQTNGHRNNDN